MVYVWIENELLGELLGLEDCVASCVVWWCLAVSLRPCPRRVTASSDGLVDHPWWSGKTSFEWSLGAAVRLVKCLICVGCCSTLYFSDELVNEKEKYKSITDELDQTFSELSGY